MASTVSERLVEVLREAGLTDRERHVVRHRLLGRSYGAIARDTEMAGLTRQRLQQLEVVALARLGLRGSIESVVHEQERQDAMARLRERGQLVRPGELGHIDAGAQFRVRHTPEERQHEAAVVAFLAGP
jgi:hypothetical protein